MVKMFRPNNASVWLHSSAHTYRELSPDTIAAFRIAVQLGRKGQREGKNSEEKERGSHRSRVSPTHTVDKHLCCIQ